MTWYGTHVYFGENPNRILRVDADGGKPEMVISGNDREIYYGPQLLPGGNDLLLTVLNNTRFGATSFQWDSAQIVVRSLRSGVSHVLVDGADGRYVPCGHLVYALANTLMAVPFDANTQRLIGPRVPVVDNLRRGGANASAQMAFSATGSLAYITSERGGNRVLVVADRSEGRQTLSVPPGPYNHPRLSPDGRHLFFATDESAATSQLMAAAIDTGPGFSSRAPAALPVEDIVTNRDRGGFDVMPDGQHFVVLMLEGTVVPGTLPGDEFSITLNWFDDLSKRAISR